MMHLTFADKDLVLGSEAAELIVEYAAALARAHTADTVRVHAYGADGDAVDALLLLDEGAPVMVETSHSDLPEPDNSAVVAYMKDRMAEIAPTTHAMPVDAAPSNTDYTSFVDFERDFESGPDGPTS